MSELILVLDEGTTSTRAMLFTPHGEPRGVSPRVMYSVPSDNPFVNDKRFVPETWAYGLRNPWRMCTDAKTGHIWVGQNGQDLWESAMFVRKGDNYGWSVMEGNHPFYLERKAGPTPIVKHTLEHHHSEARSLTGEIPPLISQYEHQFMRWFRVALLLSFIVLLAWFIWSVFAQKSLFDWLGDRIDHITDDTKNSAPLAIDPREAVIVVSH